MSTLSNVATRRGEANPPSVRLAPDTIPEAKNSRTGVSVRFAPNGNKNWYVFRASYGREDKASDYIIDDGTFVYIAKRYEKKEINGVITKVLTNLIPNLLFVYTTKQKAHEYIKETPELSYLTYYYNHFKHIGEQGNPPLTVPCREMENFILATCSHNEHLRLVDESRCHYKGGDYVRVVDGPFKGVEGKVARVAGQQRVIVKITQVGLVSTAYIPTAFIEHVNI